MATRAALPWPHANRAVAVPRCVLAARFRGRPRHCLPWNPACQLDGVKASKGAQRRRGCALALFHGSRAAKPGNRKHPAGCLVQWRGSRFGCERSWFQCPRQPHVDARGAPYSACRCAICRQTGNARKSKAFELAVTRCHEQRKARARQEKHASAGNRNRVASMAAVQSTTIALCPRSLRQRAPSPGPKHVARARARLQPRRAVPAVEPTLRRAQVRSFGAKCGAQPRRAGLSRQFPGTHALSAKLCRQLRRLA